MTTPPPSTVYIVDTECGRHLTWSAVDMDQLLRDLVQRNYRPEFIQELSEYEAEVVAKEAQEDLHVEHYQTIERGVA